MSIRRFFVLSFSLAVLAVGLHLAAMSQLSRGLLIRAHAITLPEADRVAAKAEAGSYANRGAVLGYIGLAFALGSVAFIIMSVRRREPARRELVFAVLICYVMLQFVWV